MITTPRLKRSAIADARSQAFGLYSLNAKGADRYGFTITTDRTEVDYGEFLFPGEPEESVNWILERETNTVRRAIHTGENKNP